MLSMNKKMLRELGGLKDTAINLAPGLAKFVRDGFTYSNGCYFLRELVESNKSVSEKDFPDRTGYECFVNSVHVDEFADRDCLLNAVLFVDALFAAWRQGQHASSLRAIVSADELDAVVKLHVSRPGESWVSDSLERYEEAILVADSSVDNLCKLIGTAT